MTYSDSQQEIHSEDFTTAGLLLMCLESFTRKMSSLSFKFGWQKKD